MNRAELNSVDARFEVRGEREPIRDVVIVAIDQKTLGELGVRPPFPRSLHARVIDRLEEAGADQIAIDIEFAERSEPREDRALLASLRRAQPVVLATHDVGPERLGIPAGEDPREVGARLGSIEVLTDQDSVVRQMGERFGPFESFPVVTVETARGEPVSLDDFSGGDAWIDFAGPPGSVPSHSYSDVLRGRIPNGEFQDKIVVVGASDPSFKDLFAVPGTPDQMPGVELHANAIATILDDFPLDEAPAPLDFVVLLLIATLPPLAAIRFTALPTLVISLAALLGLVGGVQLAFNTGVILDFTYPLASLGVAAVGAIAVDFFVEARERRRLKGAFSRFVPKDVVESVLERADEDLRLGGETLEATVLFCDLRGFTAFAERQSASTVIKVLNRYLTEVSEAVLRHRGTVVSYMGDGMMAVFGAPIEQPDHAERAVRAAREIRDERIPAFNRWITQSGLGSAFGMGIGICTGPVMSGNVGSKDRLEYTAVGDTTNVAARLQAKSKDTDATLLMAASTELRVRGHVHDTVHVGEFQLPGRATPIAVWTVRPPSAAAVQSKAAAVAVAPPE